MLMLATPQYHLRKLRRTEGQRRHLVCECKETADAASLRSARHRVLCSVPSPSTQPCRKVGQ